MYPFSTSDFFPEHIQYLIHILISVFSDSLPAHIPQILINREPLRHLQFDVELLGDCDVIINELCRRLGDEWAVHCDKPALEQIDRYNLDTPPPETVFADNEDSRIDDGSHSVINTKTDSSQSNHHLRKQCHSLSITSSSAEQNSEIHNSCVLSTNESLENISKDGIEMNNTEFKPENHSCVSSTNKDGDSEQDNKQNELNDPEKEIERLFSMQRRESLAKRLKG